MSKHLVVYILDFLNSEHLFNKKKSPSEVICMLYNYLFNIKNSGKIDISQNILRDKHVRYMIYSISSKESNKKKLMEKFI